MRTFITRRMSQNDIVPSTLGGSTTPPTACPLAASERIRLYRAANQPRKREDASRAPKPVPSKIHHVKGVLSGTHLALPTLLAKMAMMLVISARVVQELPRKRSRRFLRSLVFSSWSMRESEAVTAPPACPRRAGPG